MAGFFCCARCKCVQLPRFGRSALPAHHWDWPDRPPPADAPTALQRLVHRHPECSAIWRPCSSPSAALSCSAVTGRFLPLPSQDWTWLPKPPCCSWLTIPDRSPKFVLAKTAQSTRGRRLRSTFPARRPNRRTVPSFTSVRLKKAAPAFARSGMLFVFGRTQALRRRILLAHIGAFLGVAVIGVAAEVVDLRTRDWPRPPDPSGNAFSPRPRQRTDWRRRLAGCRRSFRRLRLRLRHRRLGGGGASAAFIDIGLFGDPFGLIGSLVGGPFSRHSFTVFLPSGRVTSFRPPYRYWQLTGLPSAFPRWRPCTFRHRPFR